MATSFNCTGLGQVNSEVETVTYGYINVTSVSLDTTSNKIKINFDLGSGQTSNGGTGTGALFAAVAAYFGGTLYDYEKDYDNGGIYYGNYMCHPRGTVSSGAGTALHWATWNKSDAKKWTSGTHEIALSSTNKPTSLSFGVRAQMVGGWGWTDRWNSSYDYNNKTGGTLYFTYPTYSISYNANGGKNAPDNQTKKYLENLTLQSGVPTRTGYTFKGWNTKADGSGTSYSSGASFGTDSDTTLYAVWSINNYKLDVNGLLDGAGVGNVTGYGTFSIDINGTNRGTNITDFYEDVTYNQTYKIHNIKPLIGHTYKGDAEYNGTMPAKDYSIQLPFVTNDIKVKANNEWKPGDVYIKKNGIWVRPTAVYIKQNGAWQKIDG